MKEYLYPAIFDSLQIEDSLFYRSYSWYQTNTIELELIMDSLVVRIDQQLPDSSIVEEKPPPTQTLDEVYDELNAFEADQPIKVKELIRKSRQRPEIKE